MTPRFTQSAAYTNIHRSIKWPRYTTVKTVVIHPNENTRQREIHGATALAVALRFRPFLKTTPRFTQSAACTNIRRYIK
jgi:hypothetical protein